MSDLHIVYIGIEIDIDIDLHMDMHFKSSSPSPIPSQPGGLSRSGKGPKAAAFGGEDASLPK